mgnify:CR=1 FL=1
MSKNAWRQSRGISKRILITATLTLLTPTHLGGGEANPQVDLPVLHDAQEPRALLTGTSLAGALRAYLRTRQVGYATRSERDSLENLLFGAEGIYNTGEQSLLIISDALAQDLNLELRDGVAIDPQTRTAADKKKFDYELLAAGTRFDLHFELLILDEAGDNSRRGKTLEKQLLQAAATALQGLEKGEIPLGARKQRGFGACQVKCWQVVEYDLATPQGLVGWLQGDLSAARQGADIAALLNADHLADQRSSFTIRAKFQLASPLLIRSGFGDLNSPDAVHLQSVLAGEDEAVPVISGTSLAGALRSRCQKICRTLNLGQAGEFIDSLFGARLENFDDLPSASKLSVQESSFSSSSAEARVQNRVKINRFTGGAYSTALFNNQPVFPDPSDLVELTFTLQNPQGEQIGLLLLALKDLWTGDLPLGGESSIGRGRLRGVRADLTYQQPAGNNEWRLETNGDNELTITGDAEALEAYVDMLNRLALISDDSESR